VRDLVRVGSGMTLALPAIFYALRVPAAQCAGPACEGYVLPSLLIPLLVLPASRPGRRPHHWTGRRGRARDGAQEAESPAVKRRYSVWLGLLVVCTLLAVLGPITSAIFLRDHPHAFVLTSTVFLCVIVGAAFWSSLVAVR
jgi:hypothetical protein